MVIVLPFETPSKKNSRVVDRRTGRSFPSKVYTAWHKSAAAYVRQNYPAESLGSGPFRIEMSFWHPTFRKCDADNKVSSILDLLVDLGIIDDDNWQVVAQLRVANYYAKNKPCAEIKIFPLTECEE